MSNPRSVQSSSATRKRPASPPLQCSPNNAKKPRQRPTTGERGGGGGGGGGGASSLSRRAGARLAPIIVPPLPPPQKLGVLEVAGDPQCRAGIATPHTADLKLPTPRLADADARAVRLPGFSEVVRAANVPAHGDTVDWAAVRWDLAACRSAGLECSPRSVV